MPIPKLDLSAPLGTHDFSGFSSREWCLCLQSSSASGGFCTHLHLRNASNGSRKPLGTPERKPVPVSARTRIATAGKVSQMTKVFQRGASAPKVDSDSESDSQSDEDHPQPGQPQRLVVPPLPTLLDGKCGQTAKPLPPRLDCVHEDSMLSGDLLSSSDDEDDEELLIESVEPPEQMSCRSTLVPLSHRSVLKSEAATHVSMELTAMSKGSRCLGVGGLGALTGGAGGAVVGMLSGIIPAPLTFGLSVPINAGIGSISGMIFGTAGGDIMKGHAETSPSFQKQRSKKSSTHSCA
ncbi:unnamed protein product [Symbiodinium sp. CCMP2456]|nr:unnamed protein product [Symbiodinium sp. CCMP2456]